MLQKILALKQYLLISLVTLILLTITIIFYLSLSNTNKLAHLDLSNKAFINQIESTVDRYEQFSSYAFEKILDDTVLEFMHLANLGDDSIKDIQRNNLYNYLIDDYDLLLDYDFRQLHFHMPNGDSFLRFHTPNTYGDNLSTVRPSIHIVNTEHRFIRAFEEGRIYNGYRFVYPLFYNETHVGSVEISISISTIIDALYHTEPNHAHFFLMKYSVVQRLVFDEYLENYVESVLSNQYVYDRAVNSQFTDRRKIFLGDDLVVYFRKIASEIGPSMESKESFSYVSTYQNNLYTLQFFSVENINEEHVGYIFTIYQDEDYMAKNIQDYIVIPGLILLFSISYLTIIIYLRDKRKIKEIARTDTLTQIANRYFFNELSIKEFHRSKRYNNELSLIVIDVDHFKLINDQFGHSIGDRLLYEIATILKTTIRSCDILARWGGEEFALILPQTPLQGAISIAEKLRELISTHDFKLQKQITISLGVSSITDKTTDINDLFNTADQNVYRAKNTGRNKVVAE